MDEKKSNIFRLHLSTVSKCWWLTRNSVTVRVMRIVVEFSDRRTSVSLQSWEWSLVKTFFQDNSYSERIHFHMNRMNFYWDETKSVIFVIVITEKYRHQSAFGRERDHNQWESSWWSAENFLKLDIRDFMVQYDHERIVYYVKIVLVSPMRSWWTYQDTCHNVSSSLTIKECEIGFFYQLQNQFDVKKINDPEIAPQKVHIL